MLRVVGISDEQTVCDACGRVDLKATCVVHDQDGHETGRYGRECVRRVVGYSLSADQARRVEINRRERICFVLQQARKAVVEGNINGVRIRLRDADLIGMLRADERQHYQLTRELFDELTATAAGVRA